MSQTKIRYSQKKFFSFVILIGILIFYFIPLFANATLSCLPLSVDNYVTNIGSVILSIISPLLIFPVIVTIFKNFLKINIKDSRTVSAFKLRSDNVLFPGIIGGLIVFFTNNLTIAIRDYIITDRGATDITVEMWDNLLGMVRYPLFYSYLLAIILICFISYIAIPRTYAYANIFRISHAISMSSGPLIWTLLMNFTMASAQSLFVPPSPCADYVIIKASSWNGYATSAFIAGILIILAVLFYRNILSKTTIKSN